MIRKKFIYLTRNPSNSLDGVGKLLETRGKAGEKSLVSSYTEIYLVRPKGVRMLQQPQYSLSINARESANKARKVKPYVSKKSEGIPDWSAVNTDEYDYGKLRKANGNTRKHVGSVGKDGKRAQRL